MSFSIYLSPPVHGENELKNAQDAIQSGWISTQGPYIESFTSELDAFFNKKTLLTNSGTSAIHLALILAGIRQNDRVLCSNFTFAASANPILYQKGIPIFVGIEKKSWNICPKFLLQAIQQSEIKPKALVLTHVYGMPAQMDEIVTICAENNIILIEDAAEALGATYNKKHIGSFGEYGILSFNGNKIITTSSGGALICRDNKEKNKAKKIASQAKEAKDFYFHKKLGYNYLQSNILAAIGQAQFEKLPNFVVKRRKIFTKYQNAFQSDSRIISQKESTNEFSNRWLSSFVFPENKNKEIREKLLENSIETRYLFTPLNSQPLFSKYAYFGEHYENELFENGLSLPSGNQLNESEQNEIINIIKNIL